MKFSEDYVRQRLVDRGFAVNEKHENSKGIDIVAIKDGHYFLIEVKRVALDNGSLRIRNELPEHDVDFVLVVNGNGVIFPKEIEGKSYQKILRFMDLFGEG